MTDSFINVFGCLD